MEWGWVGGLWSGDSIDEVGGCEVGMDGRGCGVGMRWEGLWSGCCMYNRFVLL